jgi:hypothetical protein
MRARDLYERDFYEWAVRNAELLRSGRLEEADIEHIAEEIEGMANRDRRELFSRLRVLLVHLLKFQFQPTKRSPSWRRTIRTQRQEIDLVLRSAPSLTDYVRECLPEVYPKALADTADETGLPEATFPATCPYSLDQVLDERFLPG